MEWSTIAWIVIALIALAVMARGCGGMMRGWHVRHAPTPQHDR